jgi:hypothetical protein
MHIGGGLGTGQVFTTALSGRWEWIGGLKIKDLHLENVLRLAESVKSG